VGALRRGGRVVAISAPPDGRVTFSLRDLYRKSATLHGIDSLALATVEAAEVLDRLAPAFDAGALRPPRFHERPLVDAVAAYQERGKQVLVS
jgi:NADPH:quinone reductase-like Zn-dependent oxidoreductase